MNYILVAIFLLLQWIFTIYEYNHQNIVEFDYFLPDALAILLLFTASIIAVPAFYHSYVFFTKNEDNPRNRAMYYASMVILIFALSMAYLSNHIAVTWIFVEMTTLSASALIYHRRNVRTLEGTWKYIFICSISITFVFIGILFLSIAVQQLGISDLTFTSLIKRGAELDIFWLRLAFIFIFTGYTAKIGLVPMYTAGIDAKDKAPS
ncbi:MAG: hypothetical protein PHW92_13370, partial [Lutibacter sp.]|nr:hypothetical protein [Lutibacter sp.]